MLAVESLNEDSAPPPPVKDTPITVPITPPIGWEKSFPYWFCVAETGMNGCELGSWTGGGGGGIGIGPLEWEDSTPF